ncbi:MAG: cbb3-type cytochrome oxidase assembly protein CcoS [Acidobacteria bacterium]|uniref:Cbb3-type cytochrome oxidase assembly protein CcoS n=1 Tax=Candidatus Polarisedimenticola svalbardensis TaxID=2886004 RepID=A0A8J6Y699_9BACT|nr:cbb3-type cytochrome oxidase assembly protein CcoS [Candidatus Polarisedimenticola svalbardensis]
MNVVYILLPVALLIAVGYLILFIISVRKGQYDDTTTPAVRMLFDDDEKKKQDDSEQE